MSQSASVNQSKMAAVQFVMHANNKIALADGFAEFNCRAVVVVVHV